MKPRISIAVGLMLSVSAGTAFAADQCATGKTLEDGKLTIATGNPAYFPWVLDDAPEAGKGFEAAVAYAVAAEMGFEGDNVVWVRAGFDESIQPGAKNFDFNLQQFSITGDRAKVIDFSVSYYTSAMAVLTTQAVVDAGAEPTLASLKTLKWGAGVGYTAIPVLTELVAPESDALLYNDNTDVTAAIQAGQIDVALFDLPTALYLAAVVVDGGVILGQFPAGKAVSPDNFGMLLEKDSDLTACVDEAIGTLKSNGTLAGIEATWLAETTGVPVIK